jgi:hypothetical protein
MVIGTASERLFTAEDAESAESAEKSFSEKSCNE